MGDDARRSTAGGHGRAVGLAVCLGALGFGAGVAAAVVTQAANAWGYSAYDPVPLDIAVALFFGAMGVLVTWHKPGNRVGWALLIIAAVDGVGVLLTALTGAFDSPDHPAVDVLMAVQQWLWAPPIWAISTLLPMIYPDGRLAGSRWWWAVAGTVAGIVVYVVGLALVDSDFAGRYTVHNPWAVPGWQGFATFCLTLGEYLLLAMTVVAAAGLVLRWWRASGVRRRQLAIVLVVFAFGAAQAILRDVLPGQLPLVLERGLEVLAFSLFPLAIAVAITRDRLFDLDLAVRRGIVGVAMVGTLLACYVGAFAVLAVVLPENLVPGSVLAVALSGAAIFPLAAFLIEWVRRITWGRKIDIVELVTGLGLRMRNQLDATEVPGAVCEEIVSAMRLRMARLELQTQDGTRVLAQVGDGDDGLAPVAYELWHRGEQVGRLVVRPPQGRSHLDETISQALASLADQVAPVVAALRLDEELLRSREQLVTAREEERLRLSRELHDNVGPTLAGIRLQIEAARGALPADFAGAELMDRAVTGIQGALQTLRRVVHDLRPLELETLGLPGALRELAVFLSGPTLRVETALSGDVSVLSKQVEVAAYRIVAEALTNVVRHAQATHAEVSLELAAEHLVVQVRDDGVGVPPGATGHGMGMRFMAQRAREIAGEFSYSSDGNGTAIRAVLPLLGAGAARL
ncbi:MAG TPA: histidine kinase [Actinophytocola sp.]|uniref:sensor histidine kinase n=1 Tax=Actinophytocola sp. TaxID=1872138 RepID=UPI002DDD219A|nr:histidine kinase [Actinophytocola sp.]HEV2778679.1 histidine kinase [Actinophytocola sp.]